MRIRSISLNIALLSSLTASAFAAQPTTNHHAINAKINHLQQQINQLKSDVAGSNVALSHFDGRYLKGHHQYLGLNANHPLALLPGSSYIAGYLGEAHSFQHAVTLGGYIEFDPQVWGGDDFGSTSVSTSKAYDAGQGLYLTSAKTIALFKINSITSGITELKLNTGSSTGIGAEIGVAALIFGNLKESPFYVGVGRFDLAFGVFGGGGPWSSALNYDVFHIGKTSQIEVGYDQHGVTATASVFKPSGKFNTDFATSVEYTHTINKALSFDIGGGYVNDIRGTNSTVGSNYNGSTASFFGPSNPLYDVNATLNIEQFGLFAEYNITQRAAPFNNSIAGGGSMQAWVVSGSYSHPLFGKKTSYSLSYSGTRYMRNIAMPLSGDAIGNNNLNIGLHREVIASASYEAMKNIYLGPELQYATTYGNQSTWATTLDVSAYF